MIIDGHTYLGSTAYMKQTPESLIADMNRLGVDQAVVTAPPPGPFYDEANSHVMDAFRANPDRLIPLIRVNPLLDGAVEKLEEALHSGFKGVKLDPTNDGYGVSGRLDPVVEKAQVHGVPVYIHSGDSIFCPPESVAALAASHPDVAFVTDMTRRAPDAAEKVSNLYLTTRQFPLLAFQRGHASRFNLDRLIFASDSPLGSLDVELRAATLAEMEPDVKKRIMGGNLLRLLGR